MENCNEGPCCGAQRYACWMNDDCASVVNVLGREFPEESPQQRADRDLAAQDLNADAAALYFDLATCSPARCPPGTYGEGVECVDCAVGTFDEDQDPATPCALCSQGTYAEPGAIECTDCAAGTADFDQDPATPCTDCVVGQHAEPGAVQCVECAAGTADHDSNPATPCAECSAVQ